MSVCGLDECDMGGCQHDCQYTDKRNLINDMSVSDLLSLYEDACELEYYEMQEAIRLTLKQRSGEMVSKEEYEACIQQWLESGGTLHATTKGS